MVVFTRDDAGFAEVAERIATDRGEELTGDFEAALERDGPVVWVDDLTNVHGNDLLELQKRLLDRGPDRGGFGVVTGYAPEMAADLYFERVDHDGEDALVYATLAPDELPDPPGATVLDDDEATAENVAALTDDPARSFQILGNGRAIHVYLSDGLVCGFPESQQVADYPDPQPYCVTDGERDCPLQGDLLPAESIDAAHFFVSSCAATIDNGTGGLPVHVSLGLLNGADSLIGSYRVSPTRRHELLLHYALLASGYDATERTYLLNRNSHANDIMSHPYVAFGRPDAAVASPHEPQYSVEMESGEDGDLLVSLTDVDAHVVDLRIPDERAPASDDRPFVRTLTDTDAPVYYSVFEEDGDLRLLVYTGGLLSLDRLDLEVSANRASHVQRRIAVESAKNAERLADLGFLPNEASEQADQLRNRLRKWVPKTEAERFEADAHAEIERDLGSILGQVNSVRDDVLAFLREENPGTKARRYARYVEDADAYPIEQFCPSCGERRVHVKRISTWTGEYDLLGGHCGQCGNVFEVPAHGDARDPTYPVVRGDLDADGPRYQSIEVEFENPTDDPVQATFQPTLDHADNVENQFFEPARRDAVLDPGESHVAEFEVDTSLMGDYRHVVLGTVVANLELYTGFLSTVTGDEAGYYPPHLR